MTGLWALTKRNTKLYFKDKGTFFTSLMTPVILLVLYVTFLGNVYEDSFHSALEASGVTVPNELIKGFVGGQLVSSLLAVCCITVAFCSNLIIIKDKVSGAKKDLTMTPVKQGVLALSYSLSTFFSTLIICLLAAAVGLVYLASVGWYMSAGDVIAMLLDVVLLVLFGTALSSIISYLLSSQGQASAAGTIVSAGYGFICGAYMPIYSFSEGLQKVLMFLPGTYGTSLLRNHAMSGVFEELEGMHFPSGVIEGIKDSVDCNIYFFGNKAEEPVMYMVLIGATVLAFCLYVLMNVLSGRKKK